MIALLYMHASNLVITSTGRVPSHAQAATGKILNMEKMCWIYRLQYE